MHLTQNPQNSQNKTGFLCGFREFCVDRRGWRSHLEIARASPPRAVAARGTTTNQLGRIVDAAVRNHALHLVRIRDIVERIARDDDDVGQFARLDGAGIEPERLRRIHGSGFQCFVGVIPAIVYAMISPWRLIPFGVSVPATTSPPARMTSITILPLPPAGSPPGAFPWLGCAATCC